MGRTARKSASREGPLRVGRGRLSPRHLCPLRSVPSSEANRHLPASAISGRSCFGVPAALPMQADGFVRIVDAVKSEFRTPSAQNAWTACVRIRSLYQPAASLKWDAGVAASATSVGAMINVICHGYESGGTGHRKVQAIPKSIGYARVSMIDKTLALQRDALKAAGDPKVYRLCASLDHRQDDLHPASTNQGRDPNQRREVG